MAGRHVNSGKSMKLPYRKGQLRRRAHGREKPDTDAVSRQNFRRQLRILSGVVSAVIGHRNPALQIFSGFLKIISNPLCRPSYGKRIHAVGSRSADSSQSCRSKHYFLIKPIIDFLPVRADGQKFFSHRIFFRKLVQPDLVFFLCVHYTVLLFASSPCCTGGLC